MIEFNGILTATVFLPALGALIILVGSNKRTFVRIVAALVTFCDFILTIAVFVLFNRADGNERFQFIDEVN